jgi:hypothetical protein
MDWSGLAGGVLAVGLVIILLSIVYFLAFLILRYLFKLFRTRSTSSRFAHLSAGLVVALTMLAVTLNVRLAQKAGAPISSGPVLPTRVFASPNQYPPKSFAAYGIVAFPAKATTDQMPRYTIICEAYVTTLLFYTDVHVPLNRQMVTVWPIESDQEATWINKIMTQPSKVCDAAVSHYGLLTAQEAIVDAKNNNARMDGLGPFLLAWSPSEQKGKSDVLVLVSDLSEVTTTEQAQRLFREWAHDIEENPDLWENGWNVNKLKTLIRLWADKYGERLLHLAGGK